MESHDCSDGDKSHSRPFLSRHTAECNATADFINVRYDAECEKAACTENAPEKNDERAFLSVYSMPHSPAGATEFDDSKGHSNSKCSYAARQVRIRSELDRVWGIPPVCDED